MMEPLDPQLATAFAVTTGIGFLMLFTGVHKSLLEWRNRRRHCPSCGRLVDGRVCRACTHTG
jgi:succinate dehydrogenase/fumarate reductase-like Fe-S protein